jgi:hypothetical protein
MTPPVRTNIGIGDNHLQNEVAEDIENIETEHDAVNDALAEIPDEESTMSTSEGDRNNQSSLSKGQKAPADLNS